MRFLATGCSLNCVYVCVCVCVCACVCVCVCGSALVHVVNRIPAQVNVIFYQHLKPDLTTKSSLFSVIIPHTNTSVCLYLLFPHFFSFISLFPHHCRVIRSLKCQPHIDCTFLRLCSNQPPTISCLGNRKPISEQIREQRCSAGVDSVITV